jgi:hypothetical protein
MGRKRWIGSWNARPSAMHELRQPQQNRKDQSAPGMSIRRRPPALTISQSSTPTSSIRIMVADGVAKPADAAHKFTLCAADGGIALIFLNGAVTLVFTHDLALILLGGDAK